MNAADVAEIVVAGAEDDRRKRARRTAINAIDLLLIRYEGWNVKYGAYLPPPAAWREKLVSLAGVLGIEEAGIVFKTAQEAIDVTLERVIGRALGTSEEDLDA